MKTCSECGEEFSGRQLSTTSIVMSKNVWRCPNCGAILKANKLRY